MEKKEIKLIALDLDGTFLNEAKQISEGNALAVREALAKGVEVAAATGRSYVGLPVEALAEVGIRYAITANGASIYRIPQRECIYSSAMSTEFSCELIRRLKTYQVHVSIFMDGDGYSEYQYLESISRLNMPDNMKEYMRRSRKQVENLEDLIREKDLGVQKITLNFYYREDGTYEDYEEIFAWLSNEEGIDLVTGGYHNLEITRKGTTKGNSLKVLAEMLGLGIWQTMACGDTENDIDIIKTAGLGIAMGNATEDVKAIADDVTLSNEEDGVAAAIRKWVL